MILNLYDETNPLSIENYAQNLIGQTFKDVLNNDSIETSVISEDKSLYGETHKNVKRKGGLGELIEECFFHYKCNNDSKPDFDKAGVELKVTPYKMNKNKSYSAKERLIITMIDYFNVINEDFETSHVFQKSNIILLVYYLYSKEISNRLDYKINFAKLFTPPKEDFEIIKKDFETIINKIKAGKAHELSEGDTMYLGAATKASSSKDRRKQPFSEIEAKPRAFSFKTSYMTYVLNNFIMPNKTTYEPILKDSSELKNNTFENIIINRINSFAGKSDLELCNLFNRPYNNNKSQWIDLAYRMLGIKSNKAMEFAKANITVKALRIESQNNIIESSPLPSFKFKDFIDETWEESSLFNYLDQQKFLFVIYKKENSSYILKGAQLWNIPYNDLNIDVQNGWIDIKNTIIKGIKFTPKIDKSQKTTYANNLPKKGDNRIIHIRPHAPKSAYKFEDGTIIGNISSHANELPDGRFMTKQSFWLNNSYILSQIDTNLLK